MAPTYIGDFAMSGRDLRLKGQNRIGNLIVPNGVSMCSRTLRLTHTCG